MIASTNYGLFITAHTTSDNFNTVSPSDGDVETVWLDITVSESDGEEDKVFVLATFSDCFIEGDISFGLYGKSLFKPVFIGVLCSSAIFVYIHIKSFVYKVQITDNKSSGNIY